TKSTAAKPSDKKSTGKESNKIKSSEFVRESDEEDDSYLPPSTTKAPSSTKSKAISTSAPQAKPITKLAREEPDDMDSKPIVKKTITKTTRDDSDDMDSKPAVNKKPKFNNTSPQK